MKKIALISMAVLALLLTQCKKKNITPAQNSTEKVHISFNATNGGEKTVFDGGTGSYTWSGIEYIYVGGDHSGYLGYIDNSAHPGEGWFDGTVDAPSASDTKLNFIYLGKGGMKSISKKAVTTTMDFSNQSAEGTPDKVTKYHIAMFTCGYTGGSSLTISGNMTAKISIARFNLSGFDAEGNVYMHGDAIYNTANINFKTGNVTGTKGDINIGNGSDKYIAMIPQTSPSRTIIEFDNDKYSGQLVFLRGVEANKYYCKDHEGPAALPIASNSIPTNPLTSAFSVSSTKQVKFSPGNLRYNYKTKHWSFAAHQYDYLNSYSQTGYQDLFSWGQNGLNGTVMNDYNSYKSSDSNLSTGGDWGDVISDGWRTLKQSEWDYMINGRTATYRFAKATVCGVKGLIILPDDWDNSVTLSAYNDKAASFDSNTITTNEDWLTYQTKGAVFLPFFGFRQGANISNIGVISRYWSASHAPKNANGNQCAYVLQISNSNVSAGASGVRNEGAYVRLVKDILTVKLFCN